jgi:hypothetical protein
VSYRYNFAGVIDLFVLAAIVARVMAPTCMRETLSSATAMRRAKARL